MSQDSNKLANDKARSRIGILLRELGPSGGPSGSSLTSRARSHRALKRRRGHSALPLGSVVAMSRDGCRRIGAPWGSRVVSNRSHGHCCRVGRPVKCAAPSWLPGTTAGYVEKVRSQFLSLRHTGQGRVFSRRSSWQLSPVRRHGCS
jgi:hypothetical protein